MLKLSPGFWQFLKYCCVGVIITAITLCCVFLLTWQGLSVYVANLLGYIVGITVSYILNSKLTFAQPLNRYKLFKFLIGVGISYLLNLVIIYLVLSFNPQSIYISQLLGAIMYTTSGFFISKLWALK